MQSQKEGISNKFIKLKYHVILFAFKFYIAEYLKKILNPEAISERRAQIIKRLHEEAIDFRSLNQFRDKLFDSPN